ncbi:MAG: hypothetical protein ABMB14_29620 [Myxococcota bacterium]
MPLEDDYLLRQFQSLVALITRIAGGGPVPDHELEAVVREVTGLDLATIDRLPGGTLRMLLDGDGPDAVGRRRVLADLLEVRGDPSRAAALRT